MNDKTLYPFRFSIDHCLRSLEQNSAVRFVHDKVQEGMVHDDVERCRAGHAN